MIPSHIKLNSSITEMVKTHNFNWHNPILYEVGEDVFKDYKCINCGYILYNTISDEDKHIHELRDEDACVTLLSLRPCNEIIVKEILE